MNARVMIVDDERPIRESLQGLLEDEGYAVVCAPSGEEAVARFRKQPVDCIVLDIWMPGIDGLETMNRIRQMAPEVPVIVMSGHATIDTAVRATRQGAYDFLEKPLSSERLLILLRNAVEKRRLELENDDLKQSMRTQSREELIGSSAAIQEVASGAAHADQRAKEAEQAAHEGREMVSRNIDVGQTVAASFQTPTLFQIAEDLTRMQIDTSMAEADVGAVKVGQKVEFTVDAYPNRSFHGEVRQVRLNPTIQQNVVTYDVVINVNNPEKLLLPGMTAYVTVEVARRDNVLRIPNAALRFTPAGAPPAPTGAHAARVYRLEGGHAVPVTIETGLADAKYTEVVNGALKAGEPLVVEDLNPTPTKRRGGLHFRPF